MNPVRALTRLASLLQELGAVVDWPDERLYLRVEGVSGWSPAQHVDHALRTLDRVRLTVEGLQAPATGPAQTGGGPTFAGRVVLTTGWIPRGRGEAPPGVRPDPRPVRHRLRVALGDATQWHERLLPRAAALRRVPGRVPHPLLGAFTASDWIRFAQVHTRHHLAIIADIDQRRAVAERAPAVAESSRARDEPEYGVGTESP